MDTNAPRLLHPDRLQHVFEATCLDGQLASGHRARLIWAFVEGVDVSGLEARVQSRPGRAGAPAISPRLLLALCLCATLDGVGSSREVARLCEEHVAYRWLCGHVAVNHHTISDFRGGAEVFLDGMLSEMIAVLVKAGVVDGSTIYQDGTKVRASAGSSSFRREASLERLQKEAAEHVASVKAQATDQKLAPRVRAARERAARERQERVAAALVAMEHIQRVKERNVIRKGRQKPSEARASTSDPEARVMKTSSGSKHAAYNVQLGTDGKSRAIVGVQVVQNPVDYGLSEAMRLEVERRTCKKVKVHVTDAGYISKETIEREESLGVMRIMPLPTGKDGKPCVKHQPVDGPGVRAWRERMQTDEAKDLMRQRSGIAETPNGELKTYRAMDRLLVRGIRKATSVILLSVIAYNLLHFADSLIGQAMPRI